MTYCRTFTPICPFVATAVLALAAAVAAVAQSPAPKTTAAPSPARAWDQTPTPPAPAPRAVAMPAPAPMPAMAPEAWEQTPMPPAPPEAWVQTPTPPSPPAAAMQAIAEMDRDAVMARAAELRDKFDFNFDFDFQDQMERVKEMTGRFQFDADEMSRKAIAMADLSGLKIAFAPQTGMGSASGMGNGRPMPPMPPMQASTMRRLTNMSDDQAYSRGQSALDNRQWDQAVEYFSQVVSRNSARADGALYWKAYALGKLGKRDDGLAAIAELRKSYASSRWLDDAKALELEVRQASGQTVSPESESDDELKLMAINGLMQSDPERAIPLVEKQLKGSSSPRVKKMALFVLAQSSSPKAQAMIEQIARGGANPDLQVKAITYMTERRRTGNAQILSEIYAATTDIAVKRAILQAYTSNRDKDRLLQAAKSEKTPELREMAISYLGESQGNPELWQLYQSETTSEGKLQLLRYMHSNSNADKLLEVVRADKDPKVRIAAMRALASQRAGASGDALASIYNAEQDPQVKQAVLDCLMAQHNAKALVDIARAEKDTKMKLRIVERLSNMKSKEATDYLQEILSK